MKKILTGIIIILASASGAISQNAKPTSWHVKITPHATKKYIDSVVTEWRKNNIDLGFTRLDYDSNGVLGRVEFTVLVRIKAGNPPYGTFTTDKVKREIEITVTDKPSLNVLIDPKTKLSN